MGPSWSPAPVVTARTGVPPPPSVTGRRPRGPGSSAGRVTTAVGARPRASATGGPATSLVERWLPRISTALAGLRNACPREVWGALASTRWLAHQSLHVSPVIVGIVLIESSCVLDPCFLRLSQSFSGPTHPAQCPCRPPTLRCGTTSSWTLPMVGSPPPLSPTRAAGGPRR